MLASVVVCQRDGAPGVDRDAMTGNYRDLLDARGKNEAEIDATLATLLHEVGWNVG